MLTQVIIQRRNYSRVKSVPLVTRRLLSQIGRFAEAHPWMRIRVTARAPLLNSRERRVVFTKQYFFRS